MYKKLYAEMTNKQDRKRRRRARRQLSLSKESSSSAKITESDSVGNFYSDSEDGDNGKLFITKIAKVRVPIKPSSSSNLLSSRQQLPPLVKKTIL